MAFKSFLGATLPRSRQAIILVLGFCLTGIWAWQAGFIQLHSPPGSVSPQLCFIDINGEVSSPGVQLFSSSPTLQQVWEKAGGQGTLPGGFQFLTSGSKVTITSDRVVTVSRMSGRDLLTLGLTIDPNQASAADLEAIPGIGPVLAGRIIEFREQHGPFQQVEDLVAVPGLGPRKLEKMRHYLAVSEISTNREDSR
jgi:competence protein ComEA